MADLQPPRLAEDERTTQLALLQFQRESLVRKVEGIDETAARWSPVDSGTSLLWLLKHVRRAEIIWVLQRFVGEPGPMPDDTVHPEDTVADAVAAYEATCAEVDAVVLGGDLDEVCRAIDREPNVSLRWVVAHLLEETARHAGHADILRELLDGETGR
jgi:hypothetical protein